MKQRIQITALSMMVSILMIAVSCTRGRLPKILVHGLVDGSLELSVLDLNSGSREYIPNSNVITPTSFSYCGAKKEIVYSAFVENGEELVIWEINNKTYALTKGNNQYRFPVWSHDCLYIAFNSSGQDGRQVYILNMRDKTIRPLISNQETLSEGASWSPDSNLIATYLLSMDSAGQKTGYNLGIVSRENGNLFKEIDGTIDFPFSELAWDNDGQYFLFAAKRESTFDLYKYDINSETTTRIFGSEKDDRFPVMSPDGKRFVFLQSEPNQSAFRIGLFDLSLQSTIFLSDYKQNISSLLWLNSEQVVYSTFDQALNKTSFYRIRINGGKQAKLGDWDGQYISPTLFP